MTDKNQIKQYLQDRLQGLEDIKKDREWTTAELGDVACCKQTLAFIDSLQEDPVSNDLEEAANNYVGHAPEIDEDLSCFIKRNAFIAGAKWQKEQMIAKACVFLESTDFCKYYNREFIEEFKKAMEE